MKIDKDIVDLAIEELKLKNERASIAAVMRLTGYKYVDLIEAGYQHLARSYNKTSKTPTYTPPIPQAPNELLRLDHTVDAYTAHIRDNYFAHPETLNQVAQALTGEIDGFQSEIYRQAVNLMQFNKQIQEQPLKPEHYLYRGEQPKATDEATAGQEPQTTLRTIYLVASGSIVLYEGNDLDEATEYAGELSHRRGGEFNVYKLLKRVSVEIKKVVIDCK